MVTIRLRSGVERECAKVEVLADGVLSYIALLPDGRKVYGCVEAGCWEVRS